jgi:rare lipoprotein A (peptidoglycan hydrolase)
MLTVYRGARMHQCRVADRGPAKRLNRVLDLPPPMARDLGITKEEGLGHVTIRRSE